MGRRQGRDRRRDQPGRFRSVGRRGRIGRHDTAESEQKKYLRGEEGIAASDRSNLLRAQREAAGYYSPLRHLQNEALTQMVSSRELEMPENAYNAILTGASSFQQGSRGRTNSHCSRPNFTNRLSGYKEGREYLYQNAPGGFDRSTAEKDLADAARLLKRLADAAENGARKRPIPLSAANRQPVGERDNNVGNVARQRERGRR